MTQSSKLIEKFKQDPTSLKFKEIEKILINLNFVKRQAKGSHTYYAHDNHRIMLSFPLHNNDCKPIYKKLSFKAVKHLL